ncbi:unnamed protein product [Calypogeia fissa]
MRATEKAASAKNSAMDLRSNERHCRFEVFAIPLCPNESLTCCFFRVFCGGMWRRFRTTTVWCVAAE